MPCVAARPCSWVACTAHGLRQKTGSVANSSSRTPNRPNRVARPSPGALPRGTVHGDAGRLAARARARPRAPPRRRTASSGQISPDHPRRVALTHRLPRARSQVRSMVGKARADHFSPKIKYYRPRPVHRRHRRRRDGLRMRAREHGRHGRHGMQSHVCGVVCGVVCWREWRPESCWRAARIGRAARATVPV